MRSYVFSILVLSLIFEVSAKAADRKSSSCSRPPPSPKPGGFSKPSKSRYRVGAVVTYFCKESYVLRGVKRRICRKNGRWDPQGKKTRCEPIGCSKFPSCCNVLSSVSNPGPVYPFGAVVKFSCSTPLELRGPNQLVCNETGKWHPDGQTSRCILPSGCLSPPPPPTPNGLSSDDGRKAYSVGAKVNYSCPSGYGLDGLPYKICNNDGKWLPFSKKHLCVASLATCPDPGIPENGIRRAESFADGHIAGFGCKEGYRHRGNYLRTCHASDTNNSFWDGEETVCIDMFKNSNELAAQLRETFIDRTLSCDTSDANARGNASELNSTVGVNNDHEEKESDGSTGEDNTFCLGRTVVLGEGCVDLIYAIDCSRSMTEDGFNKSKEFVSKTIRLFELDKGKERVCLITYDDEAHLEFCFDDMKSTSAAMAKVENATFCGGATSTTRLIQFIIEKVLNQTRGDCKKALFLISDGQNNWGGDPEKKSKRLKSLENFEIYTIAIGESSLGWDSLKRLASGSEHFFAVRDAKDIESVVLWAIKVPQDYGRQCGRVAISEHPCRDDLNDHCRSARGAWPWMVGIYVLETSNSQPEIICGGVLIGNCYVLTAAHCLYKRLYKHLLVVVGNTDMSVDDMTEETRTVEEVIIHSRFERNTLDYDVALLKLECNVTYSTYVKRICLPKCEEDSHLFKDGKVCTVAGWGATEISVAGTSFKMSTHLHHIHLPIANLDNCKDKSNFPITDRMICAGDASGDKGACQGDSGGPLFCKEDDQNRWVLAGIVSWGEGCRRAHKYDIFANICSESGNFSSWITEQTFRHPCNQCTDMRDCKCQEPVVNIV